MLTSYPNHLDSTFCNPVARATSTTSSNTTTAGDHHTQELCFQLPAERHQPEWLGVGLKKSCATAEDLFWWTATGDCNHHHQHPVKDRPVAIAAAAAASKKTEVMEKRIEPDDDLRILSKNCHLLETCGYYYGNLSFRDAFHMLRQCKVGTFLVRDSEHHSYLYALSVQTKRGPTSCRLEYLNGRFRLDSSQHLADKMPRFDSVPDLIDHYVQLTKNLPRKNNSCKDIGGIEPVWLDMDEENSRNIPVQIYKPRYKNVRSLKHLCRVSLVTLQKDRHPTSSPFCRTIDEQEFRLPTMLKDYLKEYPHPQ